MNIYKGKKKWHSKSCYTYFEKQTSITNFKALTIRAIGSYYQDQLEQQKNIAAFNSWDGNVDLILKEKEKVNE